MKKILLAATALSLAGTAFAADLPARKSEPAYVPPPPPPAWTGFYVGLNAGGAFGGSTQINTYTAPLFAAPAFAANSAASTLVGGGYTNVNNGSFLGGGQIGYNYQVKSFVVGLEVDFQGVAGTNGASTIFGSASIDGAPGSLLTSTIRTNRNLDYLGTVRGRVGYLVMPTLLVFASGGLAYGGASVTSGILQTDSVLATSASAYGSYSNNTTGFAVGGGAEWMFMPNWSTKIEYVYYDLGTVKFDSVGLTAVDPATSTIAYSAATRTSARFNGNIVRAGLNYHFNFGGSAPVIAKF